MPRPVPPVIFLAFAGAMYLTARYLPFGQFRFTGDAYVWKGLAVLGFLIPIVAIVQFAMAKTTTDPRKPEKAERLVTGGIFSITRNPMYLGMLILLLAATVKLGNAFCLLLVLGFVAVMERVQIAREEAALSERFGKDFSAYRNRVRRWF